MTPSLEGRTLGEFAVRELMAEGGFGQIYRAEQRGLRREAVIKVQHGRLAGDEGLRQRFLREALLASRLDHPCAAHIYAFGAEDDGVLWIAMELVRGTSLAEHLARGGPLSLEELLPLFDSICDVVHNAHQQGVVHRDLKPANIMVTRRGGRLDPKLLDFGLARVAASDAPAARGGIIPTSVDEPGTAVGPVGSPWYMSPEQWRQSKDVGPRADIYALGVVAWECLRGTVPFPGTTIMTVARAHLLEPFPPLGPPFPAELSAALARAAAKDPAQRFASAPELAAAVRAASGLAADAGELPRLGPELRPLVAMLPQPIAEAVAVLDAARNAHQARDALFEVTGAAARFVAVVALAARSRLGEAGSTSGTARDLLGELRHGELDEPRWLALASALVAPHAARPEAYPVPELVPFAAGLAAADSPWEQLRLLRRPDATSSGVRDLLSRALPELERLLASLAFLIRTRLCVVRADGLVESWAGERRVVRALVTAIGPAPTPGHAILVNGVGRPVLSLHPLVQAAPPTPGAPEELFVIAGGGARGARLTATPRGFERHDAELWESLRQLFVVDDVEVSDDGAGEASPYRGLETFTPADATRFFGRERQVDAFVNRLRVRSLLVVAGPSGAGKSSFVQAGVVPALGSRWRVLIVRPGARPVTALAARLQRDLDVVPDADPARMADALVAAARRLGGNVLLVVDQLEELFTVTVDAGERERFAAILAGAARGAADPVRIVLTLREDFLGRAERLAAFRERLTPGVQLLTTPAPEDLLRIVVEPARRARHGFDDEALPEEMVRAVADEPSALALLSFAAAELWKRRDRHFRQLLRAAYDDMGGVVGALAVYAEELLSRQSAAAQRLVREAFRHLVTAEGTRAVLTHAELGELLGGGAEAAAVIESLIGARLLVASEDGGLEIVHEALLTTWPRLVTWRREDAEGARLRDQMRSAARQWEDRGRARGLLWRDEALDELRVWRARFGTPLTAVETAFAETSLADAARARRRRRAAIAAVVALLLAAVVVLARQRARSESDRDELIVLQAREMLLRDPTASLAWLKRLGRGWTAERWAIAVEAVDSGVAEHVIDGHSGIVFQAEFAPDGRSLASSASDNLRLWDAAGQPRATYFLDEGGPWYFAYEPTGGRLAVIGLADLRLWDPGQAGAGRVLGSQPARAQGLRLTADGRMVTIGVDGKLRVWDAGGAQRTVPFDGGRYRRRLALSPDGRTAAVAGADNAVLLLPLDEGTPRLLAGATEPIMSVAFSPDGKQVAAGGWDRTLHVWELATGERRDHAGHAAKIFDVAFAPDGRRVATGSEDATVRLWDVASGDSRVLLGHAGVVTTVAFAPDGARLLSGDTHGQLRIWATPAAGGATQVGAPDAATAVALAPDATAAYREGATIVLIDRAGERRRIPAAEGDALALAADGSWIAAIDGQGAVQLLEAQGGRRARLQLAGRRAVEVLLTGGARWIAVKDAEGTVALYRDGADPELVESIESCPFCELELAREADVLAVPTRREVTIIDLARGTRRVHAGPGGPFAVALSRDGRRTVVGGTDGGVRAWDEAAGGPPIELAGHRRAIGALAITDDGRTIAAAAYDQQILVWRPGQPAQLLRGDRFHREPVFTLRFSHGGTMLASGSVDGVVRVWDLRSGAGHTHRGHQKSVTGLAFTSDDETLLSSSGDHTVRRWRTQMGAALPTAGDGLAAWLERATDVVLDGDNRPVSPRRRP